MKSIKTANILLIVTLLAVVAGIVVNQITKSEVIDGDKKLEIKKSFTNPLKK